jgi:hypothetical protein
MHCVTVGASQAAGRTVPTDEILRAAIALRAHRIVLGSHGRGRHQRVVLGSTAEAGSRRAAQFIASPRSGAAASDLISQVTHDHRLRNKDDRFPRRLGVLARRCEIDLPRFSVARLSAPA